MELTVNKDDLAKALNNVEGIASAKTSMPILENILLQTDGPRLLIAATNLEIAISQKISAKIEKVGSIMVPASLTKSFISSLPSNSQVSFKVSGDHILIESGNYKSKINGFSAEDFPELPTIDEPTARFFMSTDIFKEAVDQINTVSMDTSRPILTGVFLHTFENYIYMAATDGYRLSERKLFETDQEFESIVPSSVLVKVKSVIPEKLDEIEILINDNQIQFMVGDILVISNLIDGKYVEYRRLIPDKTETTVKISRTDFYQIAKVAKVFSDKSGGSVKITANEETSKLSMHTIASEIGENTSEADAEIQGGGEVTLNVNYIENALKPLKSSKIYFGFSGKLAPTIFKNTDSDDYIHIVMPLKS